jgi:uncharacterized protein (UPF0332 family)
MKSVLLLERARKSLQVGREILAGGSPEFASSRVYYAFFYTAQALLATQRLSFARHGQVIAQYGLHFSKTRILDPAFHTALGEAFQLRQVGDYQVEVAVEPDSVERLASICEQFIEAASRYIAGLSEPNPE